MTTMHEPTGEPTATTTVNDLMTTGVESISPADSVADAARMMRDLDVGALPICDAAGNLTGMVTDRDVVVRCVAEGIDPATVPVGDLTAGTPILIESDQGAEAALRAMARHRVRRLPVIEGNALVGIVAQADVARVLPAAIVGAVLAEVSEPG